MKNKDKFSDVSLFSCFSLVQYLGGDIEFSDLSFFSCSSLVQHLGEDIEFSDLSLFFKF